MNAMSVNCKNEHWDFGEWYLQCSNNSVCICLILITSKYSRHSEVGYFWIHIFIQQNVASFEIAMNNS